MLGAELRRLRLEQGLSQRALTKIIGLSAHSNLGEYERGSRVPPMDIVTACERALATEPGYLQRLRRSALRERAREQAGATPSRPLRPAADEEQDQIIVGT
jgi:transcriptional regulator with XRE-family HTH domain